MPIKKYPPAKFCKHGLGIEFGCSRCGDKPKGVHEVPWDKKHHAYIWSLPKPAKTENRKHRPNLSK